MYQMLSDDEELEICSTKNQRRHGRKDLRRLVPITAIFDEIPFY